MKVLNGNCIDRMKEMDSESIDAIVSDPPYGLKFMGKGWDDMGEGSSQRKWHEEWLKEAFRVLKPGGTIKAFSGTRTFHHLMGAMENVGFAELRLEAWNYGSGFPKSLNIGKAIDKQRDDLAEVYQVTAWIRKMRDAASVSNRQIDDAFGFNGMASHWTSSKSQPSVPTLDQIPKLLNLLGVKLEDVPKEIKRLIWTLNGRKGKPGPAWYDREVISEVPAYGIGGNSVFNGHAEGATAKTTLPATPAAHLWDGWGTALKPAWEPICIGRKP